MIIGVVGGGQLGRMLALAGHPLGLRLRCLDASPMAPAGAAAELITGSFEDPVALERLCEGIDLVTWEFESLQEDTVRWLANRVPAFPPPRALLTARDRVAEKRMFTELGIAVPDFAAVGDRQELERAVAQIGLPSVLKTRQLGYDGKGQAVLRSEADVEPAWERLGGHPLVLERFVPFDRELSVLAVRGRNAEERFYPIVENQHRSGILSVSRAAPSSSPDPRELEAREIARRVLASLDYVGVLAVELFEVGGKLLANEMAPRVHNSGHWTIEGAETSQFENHLRAVAGLPLGSTRARRFTAMINLVGRLPKTEEVLAVSGAHLHLYGKRPLPGRKVGHVTVSADEAPELERKIAEVRALTSWE